MLTNGLRQLQWLFHRCHARHALRPIHLVAGNALAHLIIPRLGGGDQHGTVVCALLQPQARQAFCPARLAAFLSAQDELAAGNGEQWCIHAVVPFGFVKNGINYNYYDEKPLQAAMLPLIRYHLRSLLDLGMNPQVCYYLGEGLNYKFLAKFNEQERLFGKVVPLPHPRFIMQYRRKRLEEFVEVYLQAFAQ